MAVGAVICSDFDFDEMASDGVSEPWQVYEWYVVQALVKTFFFENREAIRGLPGSEKGSQAYLQGVPLNTSRYLKTASVFGFHGVYRTLANELHIIDGYNALGELGDLLVRTWEKEQKLDGFYSSYSGAGRDFRNTFLQAIKDGLQKAEVARSWHWNFNKKIAQHLAPYKGGRKEMNEIHKALVNSISPLRAEVIEFLQTDEARSAWTENKSEKGFHEALFTVASEGMKELLLAIKYYEKFSRLIQDAFDSTLHAMSQATKISSTQLAELEPVKIAANNIHEAYEKAHQYLEPVGEAFSFFETFNTLNEVNSPKVWIDILFQYHKYNQRRKSPAGKRPWVEQVSGDTFMIYSKYIRDKVFEPTDEYVSFYRTNSLYSFLKDLKRIIDE